MKVRYFLLLNCYFDNNELENELKIKVWSPDYKTSFIINLPEGSRKKSDLRCVLEQKMNLLISRQELLSEIIVTTPELKHVLQQKYPGQWFGVDIDIQLKKRFFSYALPVAAHGLNLVALLCISVMSYLAMSITTSNISGGQSLSILTMIVGTIVSLIIYSFSNVTQDASLVGVYCDEKIHHAFKKIKNRFSKNNELILDSNEGNYLREGDLSWFNEFIPEEFNETMNCNFAEKIILAITGIIMGLLITTNLTIVGITLYQQFQSVGNIARDDDKLSWLTPDFIDGLAITAVASSTASTIPFQGGFVWRGTQKISSSLMNWLCSSNRKYQIDHGQVQEEMKNSLLDWSISNSR